MTHAQFIDQSLGKLAFEILADAPAAYWAGVRLLPLDRKSNHAGLEEAFASLAENTPPDAPFLYYTVNRDEFSLIKKTRRGFLGDFWIERQLAIGVSIVYPFDESEPGSTRFDVDRTYSGWVHEADLERLGGGEFDNLSIPPAEDFVSRWMAPAVVTGCLGALTYLFFSIR